MGEHQVKNTLLLFVAFAITLILGCHTNEVNSSGDGEKENGIHKNSSGKYELSNGDFKMTCVKASDEAYRIVSITNLRSDVTSIDLRKFGNDIFHFLLSYKLQKGIDLTPEDEDVLYFSMDIWIGTMNDVTTHVAKKMRPDDEYYGVPDDFDRENIFTDVKQKDITDKKRIMSAIPREELRRIRSLCAKNLSNCYIGRIIHEFGSDFWQIPREAFLYQIASVQGELLHHKEKRYLEPSFSNLWGLLRTNDKELMVYSVCENVVKNRKTVDQELKLTFTELDSMVAQVRAALATTGDKKSRDILRDVYEEFDQKNDELKGNIDLIIVDIPVAIYAKIALNDIDKAKSFLDDSEEAMITALRKFHERTDYGSLVARARSQSARSIYEQLIAKARLELGDKDVEKIIGRVWP
jgi:hypothetical protein